MGAVRTRGQIWCLLHAFITQLLYLNSPLTIHMCVISVFGAELMALGD